MVMNIFSSKALSLSKGEKPIRIGGQAVQDVGQFFLLIVMVISIIVFAFIPNFSFEYKIASRVVLIPLIAGISYEVIRLLDRKREIRGIQFMIRPGLWLQKLTAHEPSGPQIEVAIHALEDVLELERNV